MVMDCRSPDPSVHRLCLRIARKCVAVIEPLLREEEVREAMTEFYRAAREAVEIVESSDDD